MWRFVNTDVSKDCNAFIPEDMNDLQDNWKDIKYEMLPTATDFKSDRNDKCWHWMAIKLEDVIFHYSKRRHIRNNLDV